MATHTHDPQTTPAPQDDEKRPPFWRAPMSEHPMIWTGFALLLIALFTVSALTYQHLNRPEPATPPAAEQGVDRATAEIAAQQALQDFNAALDEAYATRSTSPLTSVASPELVLSEQQFVDNLIGADVTTTGTTTATAEVVDYQTGTPQEGWTTITMDVCFDTSGVTATLPDGSDAFRGPGGNEDTDYLSRSLGSVNLVSDATVGAEPGDWVVSGYDTDYSTPC